MEYSPWMVAAGDFEISIAPQGLVKPTAQSKKTAPVRPLSFLLIFFALDIIIIFGDPRLASVNKAKSPLRIQNKRKGSGISG